MKTKTENQKMKLNGLIFVLMFALLHWSSIVFAQEQGSTKTLLGSEVKVTEIFAPEIKINSIQGDIGTLVGFYCGPMINRTFLVGACGGVNLGHPRVNYGYFGGIGQYVYQPEEMVHFSSQLVIAYGTTKDYENPKSGPMDNFWNISGASFFLMEPGVNLEVNISNNLVLVTGVSYRYISGLNETSEDISITHVTNEDLSGINFNIGLKFCKEKKAKK
jgi:hypothetical protein